MLTGQGYEEKSRMLSTVEGIYEDGRIVLTERPPGVFRCRVLVTFVAPAPEAKRDSGDRRGKLLSSLARGLDLGGPPYPSREELNDRDAPAR